MVTSIPGDQVHPRAQFTQRLSTLVRQFKQPSSPSASDMSTLTSSTAGSFEIVTSRPTGKRFHLFGFPILHSASPAFHNFIFNELGTGNVYSPWSTSMIDEEMLAELRDPEFGGSSVTMPIKSKILEYLDEISPEGKATGACNTIVPVDLPDGTVKLVGTNTDFLGVRNALLRTLRQQHPETPIGIDQVYPPNQASGVVIGGGATTKSAVHALHTLGLSPIFLVNRDPAEVEAVVQTFPHLNLIHLAKIEDVDAHTKTSDPALVMAVGAIPAIPPSTPAERLVYTIVTHLLTSSIVVPPPTAPPQTLPSAVPTTSTKHLPFPTKRIFLDMAYKPRLTPLLRIASALGWQDVGGVQAMIEQGLAQSRMWKARNASVEVACGDGLGEDIDRKARELVEGMADVVVTEVEVDRALKLKVMKA